MVFKKYDRITSNQLKGGGKMLEKRLESFSPAPEETQYGMVNWMNDEASAVILRTPDGKIYQRAFETPFLKALGIGLGDGVELTFTEEIKPGEEATISMRVRKANPEDQKVKHNLGIIENSIINPWGDEESGPTQPH